MKPSGCICIDKVRCSCNLSAHHLPLQVQAPGHALQELLLQDLKGLESSGFATPFLYELDGIFVYGQSFGSSDLDGYNADAALKYFAQHGI